MTESTPTAPAAPVALAHGIYNVAGGLWPLLHMRSFEAVSGPKTDRWLVRTVAGLLVGIGVVQVRAARTGDGLARARELGVGTALTFAVVDVVYAVPGRIRRVYLLDAVLESAWVGAWLRPARRRPAASG